MAKKIYLSPSNQNANAYATGNTNEADQCNKIAKAAETALKRCGFDVKRAPQGQEMATSIRQSNEWKADLHIPIHTNAFNGKVTGGTLIMVYSNTGENAKAAKAIKAVLDPITPGKDYAIQTRTDLSELSNTTAIAVYIECEFHDTKTGSDFIIKNTTQLGEAIAKGICNYYKVTYKAPATQTAKPTTATKPAITAKKTVYRVQVGSYSVKANADALADKLKKQGYSPIVVKAEV